MGSRLPARLPGAVHAARALAEGAADRADRDGHRGHPRRDRGAARAGGRPALRRQLRPAEHPVPHRREEQPDQAAAGTDPHRTRRGRRSRLLPLARLGGEDRGVPGGAGHRRRGLPRRHGLPRTCGEPGPLPAGGRGRGGRHDRLRHGHRQAGRALRGSPRPAEVGRGLLPGDRPRRSRRRAGHRVAGVRPAGRGPAAQAHRRLRGRRGAPPLARHAPGRHARAVRDGRLPPLAAPGVLRAVGRAVRQLRYVSDAGRVLGRDGRGAETAVHGVEAGEGTASEVRRRPDHRHPAGQEDGQGHPVRPRCALGVRRRVGSEHRGVARRRAPAAGAAAAGGGGRLRDARADRGQR